MAGQEASSRGELQPQLNCQIRRAGAWGAEHHPILLGIIEDPRCGQMKSIIQQRKKKKQGIEFPKDNLGCYYLVHLCTT